MKLRIFVLAVLVLVLSRPAAAAPWGELGALFSKIFRSSAAESEASRAISVTKGATKGAEGTGAVEANQLTHDSTFLPAPKQGGGPVAIADYSSIPIGKNPDVVARYKSLRERAYNHDAKALVEMSDMTSSGKIKDPGEPFYRYWLYQATRVSAQWKPKFQSECERQENKRLTDHGFDKACSEGDGKWLFTDALPNQDIEFLKSFPTQTFAKPTFSY